jgi:RNA polymerase sigma-70 factor (ECF subfamily)
LDFPNRFGKVATMTSETESELIRRCRKGEAAAWDELFDRHYAAAARFVFQLGHDFTWGDAEEICQEAFLSVIRSLDSFRGGSQFQTWLFRIAANKARDYRQHRQAAKRGGGQTTISLQAENPENGAVIDPPSTAPEPDEVLLGAERVAMLHRSLDQLGEPCREIVELRYFGDLSYEEISASLNLNVKTVSSRLSKCLDRLEDIARVIFSGAKTASIPSNH